MQKNGNKPKLVPMSGKLLMFSVHELESSDIRYESVELVCLLPLLCLLLKRTTKMNILIQKHKKHLFVLFSTLTTYFLHFLFQIEIVVQYYKTE